MKQYLNENELLVKEWDYDKNNIDINLVSKFSNKKYWWLCNLGHSYQVSASSRSKGSQCPYCTNHKVLPGFNDLETRNKELLKEWDYKKNSKNGIYPNKVSQFANFNVWWICDKGHEWEAKISNRSNGKNCPYCNHRITENGVTDLFTTNPELEKLWDYDNNEENPTTMFSGSAKKVWWKCKLGHSWKESIKVITSGCRCPYCSGHQVLKGFNDITTTNPDILEEWDYDKNLITPSDLSFGSNIKVWWKCIYGHSYKTDIAHKISGRGCPICFSTNQTSFAEQAIFYYIKKFYNDAESRYKNIFSNGMELDIFIPSLNVGIEYDGSFFHSSTRSVKRDLLKYELCKNNNINLIRIKENKNTNCNNCDYVLYSEWNGNNYDALNTIINNIFSYLNVKFEADVKRDKYEILGTYKLNSRNEFSDNLLKEWNYNKNSGLSIENFSKGSSFKVWWICDKGHEWEASISKRSSGRNCPYCSNKKVLKGYNDLKTNNPLLANEWNYKKNIDLLPSDVTCGSGKKVWWICDKGHEWQAVIAKRNNGQNCPYCYKNERKKA